MLRAGQDENMACAPQFAFMSPTSWHILSPGQPFIGFPQPFVSFYILDQYILRILNIWLGFCEEVTHAPRVLWP